MIILFHKKFGKRFAKLPVSLQRKTVERIKLFQTKPLDQSLNNHALIGKWTGFRSINITGDYRAIYLAETQETVKFYTIDTHNNLYG